MSRVTETASNDNGDWIAVASQCVTAMLQQRGAGLEFATREKLALEIGNEILRVVLTRELQAIADAEGPVVSSRGVEYRRHQQGTVTYHSLVGPLRVTRWTYRARGVKWSDGGGAGRAREVAVACDARVELRDCSRICLCSFTAARTRSPRFGAATALALDARAHGHCVWSRGFGRASTSRARGARSRNVSPRGRGSDDRPRSDDGSDGRRSRPWHDPSGAVPHGVRRDDDTHEPCRETLRSWHYAASAHDGPSTVQARMMSDVRKALRLRPNLSVALVQDGAPEMWNLLRTELRRMRPAPNFLQVIDFYHLFQRLHSALSILEPDERVHIAQIGRWKKHLVTCKSDIERVLRYFGENWRGTLRTRDGSDQQERDLRLTLGSYLVGDYFGYAEAKPRGHHIGSGVTEGACKSLIMARAKRSGQRWRPKGIRAVLTLRSLVVSERIVPFWRLLLNRQAALDVLAA